ncbi:hypothetical protein [Commensalibacter oyaizuii]|uniref:Uncharacterized protein n=1 Tax=Commensalibacter oyaizuii TaxID=3043873 RepID=A0ABT6Q3G8_9PROT|nr:hypothetical protein [Commensalibacter sp. TBRC 16381]MDI2091669.1 hypothetical protein [Commensalibacter sp. TBRC 16381]
MNDKLNSKEDLKRAIFKLQSNLESAAQTLNIDEQETYYKNQKSLIENLQNILADETVPFEEMKILVSLLLKLQPPSKTNNKRDTKTVSINTSSHKTYNLM